MCTIPSYEQIRNLLGRYTECIDLGDFDALGELFAEARLEDWDGNVVSEGFEGVRDMYALGLQLYVGLPGTKHVTTNAQIEVAEDAATATSKSAYVVFQATPNLALQPIITGRYRDDFVRDPAGRWRFSVRRFAVDTKGDLSHHLNHEVPD